MSSWKELPKKIDNGSYKIMNVDHVPVMPSPSVLAQMQADSANLVKVGYDGDYSKTASQAPAAKPPIPTRSI